MSRLKFKDLQRSRHSDLLPRNISKTMSPFTLCLFKFHVFSSNHSRFSHDFLVRMSTSLGSLPRLFGSAGICAIVGSGISSIE